MRIVWIEKACFVSLKNRYRIHCTCISNMSFTSMFIFGRHQHISSIMQTNVTVTYGRFQKYLNDICLSRIAKKVLLQIPSFIGFVDKHTSVSTFKRVLTFVKTFSILPKYCFAFVAFILLRYVFITTRVLLKLPTTSGEPGEAVVVFASIWSPLVCAWYWQTLRPCLGNQQQTFTVDIKLLLQVLRICYRGITFLYFRKLSCLILKGSDNPMNVCILLLVRRMSFWCKLWLLLGLSK